VDQAEATAGALAELAVMAELVLLVV